MSSGYGHDWISNSNNMTLIPIPAGKHAAEVMRAQDKVSRQRSGD